MTLLDHGKLRREEAINLAIESQPSGKQAHLVIFCGLIIDSRLQKLSNRFRKARS